MSTSYETMYILRPDMSEDQVDQAIKKYQGILNENGTEKLETQHRGKRRLAYEINRLRDGIYIQMNYKGNGQAVSLMERAMRLSDEVIRYITIKQEPVIVVPSETSTSERPKPERNKGDRNRS